MGCIAVSFTKGDHELGTKCHRVDARWVSYNTRVDENIPLGGPQATGEGIYGYSSHPKMDDIVIFYVTKYAHSIYTNEHGTRLSG